MTTLMELIQPGTAEVAAPFQPRACVTPGCPHVVTEPWEDSGLLCYECTIEGELYDREARWDHVCPIPGTQCLPCQERGEARRDHLARRAVDRRGR